MGWIAGGPEPLNKGVAGEGREGFFIEYRKGGDEPPFLMIRISMKVRGRSTRLPSASWFVKVT